MRCEHHDWKGRRCKRADDGHALHVYRTIRWKGDAAEYKQTRLEVLKRHGGCCEALVPDVCSFRASQVHHVLRRSQGGDDDPTNLLAICADCHAWIHNNPAEARARGLLVRRKASL